ncbi:MAG TPA: capsule assembly Wzi family protein [Gemmatimonadaceae bacterium]|nr:capsule assembly Wzi family protein [Gemmatimonadaceae bacterium]
MKTLLAAGLSVLSLAAAVRALAQHPLMTVPIDDPIYVQLDGLLHRGCEAAFVSPNRPFMVSQIRRALEKAKGMPRCASKVLDELQHRFAVGDSASNFVRDSVEGKVAAHGGVEATVRLTGLAKGEFYPLWQDVKPTSDGDPPFNFILTGRAWVGLTQQALIVVQAYGETDTRNDPTVRAQPFRSTSGVIDFNEAYFVGRLGAFYLDFGRKRDAWIGDGTESLVLSANAPPMDRFIISAIWNKWEFHGLTGSISDVTLDSATDSVSGPAQTYHRMFIAHSLTFRPTPKIELTIGETGVIPRVGGGLNLAFANPLMVYQVTQHDQSSGQGAADANLTAFGSFRFVLWAATLQAEILIDDIQIDPQDRKLFPDLLGWNFKATYPIPLLSGSSVGVQYRRLSSFTYLEPFYTKVFQAYNQPIGSELGPGADMATGLFEVWPSGRLQLQGSLSRWRHGALRIDHRPPANREGQVGAPYPPVTPDRPDVQGAWLGDLSATWAHPTFPVTLDFALANIVNVNNVPVPSGTYASLRLTGSYRFHYPW